MTRNILLSTAIAALIATPAAFASENNATDLQGNSPAVTESGNANAVGSTQNDTDVAMKRPGVGIAEYDPTTMKMTRAQYNALSASVGADFKTQDGIMLGMVEEVTFDGQGNPEMVVDLVEDTKIDAETLIVTLLPESITLVEGQILIDTTADELYLKAQSGSKRDDETSTTVVVM